MLLRLYFVFVPLITNTLAFNWSETNFLLAFGDSYTAIQGTAGRQNYSFIGDAQNFSFTPDVLLSDEIVQNQTAAGGPVWVNYLTGCFSGLPKECAIQLWDFAFEGSDISSKFLAPHHNFTLQLVDSITQWDTYARDVIPVNVSAALVAVWIGMNDVDDSKKIIFPTKNVTSLSNFYTEIIATEFEALEKVYNAGYRSYLFMNLPPLERRPRNVSPNLTMENNYNNALYVASQEFSIKHQDIKAMVFDTHSYLSGILDHPDRFGIKNTTGFCEYYDAPDIATNFASYGCLPLSEYFWLNKGHMTFKIHEFLAGAVRDFLVADSQSGTGGGKVAKRII